MTRLNDLPIATLQFYTTAPYSCSYLKDTVARSQVATPSHAINQTTYSNLVSKGFRRSGSFTYRPFCETCKQCVPVRINTESFSLKKSQKRAWKKHKNLSAKIFKPSFSQEHYSLYTKYQAVRHSGGGMDSDSKEQYKQFLLQSHVNSLLIEFREKNKLKMISIIDKLDDGVSSVYTFFDPENKGTSYGIYSIIWQIEYCRSLKLPHLYLGYWIKDSKKMSYKSKFQSLEGLIDGNWIKLTFVGD